MLEHFALQLFADPDLGVLGGNGELQFHGVESEVRFLKRAGVYVFAVFLA